MELQISGKKGVPIAEDMIGLFFEDINFAADGGLYAEMLENGSFESLDCYGSGGDFHTKEDGFYAWSATRESGIGYMEIVSGSPVSAVNPHYLRFTATDQGQGFLNKPFDGICLEKGKSYKCSFYARCARYQGDLEISIRQNWQSCAYAKIECAHAAQDEWQKWIRYETVLTAEDDIAEGIFTVTLTEPGIVEFDFFSLIPADAPAGVFRRDLFELLKGLHPGFLRFPGGCIVEGATLANRYRWKDTVGRIEDRRHNWNRWAVHDAKEENGYHTRYSHYNQSYGLGFYEYFLLCEMIGAKPLPVLNVGLACQYQSHELVETDDPAFREFVQDAVDLIEFANGTADTKWGALRASMGHPEPFRLTMIGIGNEQWQTEKVDFFARYRAFEQAIHKAAPQIRLIGSAGPNVTSKHYEAAWEFYRGEALKNPNFVYAVDEHYYMHPDWFYEHTDFYDDYPRGIKVFSGEYAAHPVGGMAMNRPDLNILGGALAEAAFLTGVERNADVVALASYAPLFARLGFAQWSPDMIWFDGRKAYGSPSYYVQKMYGENMGTVTLNMNGQEKALREKQIYVNMSLQEKTKEIIIKAVNRNLVPQDLTLSFADTLKPGAMMKQQILTGKETDHNSIDDPVNICTQEMELPCEGNLHLPANSFVVTRIPLD